MTEDRYKKVKNVGANGKSFLSSLGNLVNFKKAFAIIFYNGFDFALTSPYPHFRRFAKYFNLYVPRLYFYFSCVNFSISFTKKTI